MTAGSEVVLAPAVVTASSRTGDWEQRVKVRVGIDIARRAGARAACQRRPRRHDHVARLSLLHPDGLRIRSSASDGPAGPLVQRQTRKPGESGRRGHPGPVGGPQHRCRAAPQLHPSPTLTGHHRPVNQTLRRFVEALRRDGRHTYDRANHSKRTLLGSVMRPSSGSAIRITTREIAKPAPMVR